MIAAAVAVLWAAAAALTVVYLRCPELPRGGKHVKT